MSTVYQILEDGKVGILESPTGTGKSLSLICGSLTWLRDHKGKAFKDGLGWDEDASDEPAWIIEQAMARKRKEMLRQREDMELRLQKVRAKEKAQRENYERGKQSYKKRKTDDSSPSDHRGDEEQFFLEDYESDREESHSNSNPAGLSAATIELMEQLGMIKHSSRGEEMENEDEIKIFYCSRTHSQLTQFINELRRVNFPPTILADDKVSVETETEDVKHLTLGSRKNLCINSKVNTLSSAAAINERCLELQQASTTQQKRCGFLPNKDNQHLVNEFRDHALATLRDIEDMGSLGRQIGICPYYASRSAIKPAEIVTLPYPLLLQKSAREAFGLSLKGHVVIIDEAHNLMDAISGIHGVEISLSQLKRARSQVGIYLQKFRNRLKGKNRIYIAQTVRIIDSLASYLKARLADNKADGIADDKELLSGKGVDQINLFKLIRYLQESKLARKVESYAVHASTPEQVTISTPTVQESTTPVLHHISSLLLALTHPSKEGRLFFYKELSTPSEPEVTLKFLLLDPSTHFQEIVQETRAVILAGGTMSPFSDYTSHLFPYLSPSSITTLSCGHVIPKSNLVAWNVSSGPGGKEKGFEFTFKNRGNGDMMDELGRALLNICTIVPDGVVVFFPSYSFLETVAQHWSLPPMSSTSGNSIWQRLEGKKSLFREKKDAGVDEVLSEYGRAINSGKGGLLLSVVGGKMSEGINFSDRLGRCVIIVGLPFPNINSAEWKAKIEYIESSTLLRLQSQALDEDRKLSKEEAEKRSKEEGREFYENACMRAVNQSVGRAIRHREDYAAILMVDKRFSNQRVKAKLPGWIREGLVDGAGDKSFGELMGTLGGFFRRKEGV